MVQCLVHHGVRSHWGLPSQTTGCDGLCPRRKHRREVYQCGLMAGHGGANGGKIGISDRAFVDEFTLTHDDEAIA